jgi:hypothetical protein
MTTDVEKTVRDLLDTNWNIGNVAKPLIVYKDDQATLPSNGFLAKVYLVDTQEAEPHGLGWTSKDVAWRVTVDLKGPDRDRMLKTVDEVIRILDAKRIGIGTDYDLMTHDQGRKVTGYANFYHFVIDCKLRRLRVPLP